MMIICVFFGVWVSVAACTKVVTVTVTPTSIQTPTESYYDICHKYFLNMNDALSPQTKADYDMHISLLEVSARLDSGSLTAVLKANTALEAACYKYQQALKETIDRFTKIEPPSDFIYMHNYFISILERRIDAFHSLELALLELTITDENTRLIKENTIDLVETVKLFKQSASNYDVELLYNPK